MKKNILTTIILLLIMKVISADILPGNIENIFSDMNQIHSFFPRPEGSVNEADLFLFIEERLKALKVDYTRVPFDNSSLYHSFSSTITVRVPGKRQDTLLLTIPVNHPYQATDRNDGSVNIALGLALLERFNESELPISVQINFTGAEFGLNPGYTLGSKLFLEEYFPDYPVMQLYFNFRDIPSRILIKGGGTNIVTPNWMITKCSDALQKSNFPFLFRGNENQVFRIGFNPHRTIIEPYLEREIPSLNFEMGQGLENTREREFRLANFFIFFNHFLSSFTEGIPSHWDHHYLFFQIKDFYFIINEQIYIILVVVILSITVIYILIFSKIFKNLIKIFIRHFGHIFLILGIIFIYAFAASMVITGISTIKNTPDLWEVNPLLFFLFKISLITLFYLISRPVLTHIKFTKDLIFYSTAGIFVLLINTIIIAIINISFTYYFLWAFIFFMISNTVRKKILKLLFFLPAPYWIIKATTELVLLSQPAFCKTLILSGITETLIISTLILPFVLKSVNIFQRFSQKYSRLRHTVLTYVFSAVSLVIAAYLMLFNPFSNEYPQEIIVKNIINSDTGTNDVEITSSSSLKNITAWIENEHYFIDSKAKKYIIPMENTPELLSIKSEQNAFLDRKNIGLTLKTRGTPYRISLNITSDREFTLFDAGFPFKRTAQGTVYEILIGVNPPNPFNVLLTLPSGYTFNLLLKVEYTEFPFRFEFSGANKKIISSLIIKREIVVDT